MATINPSTVPDSSKSHRYETSPQGTVRPVIPNRTMDKKKIVIISSIGTVLLLLGIIAGTLWVTYFCNWTNTKILTLTQSSITYDMWKETPIPMYLKFYMFNWTNSHEFLSAANVKPHFEEMGPYVFREIDYKVNQIWHENGTVTFQRRKVWIFEDSLSKGSLSDIVTNLNPIVATVAYSVRNKSSFIRKLTNKFMESLGEKLVVTKSVNSLLFDGYNDTLLNIARKMNATDLPYEKFGWFYGRNGSDSYDGTFNMFTGENDFLSMGVLNEWNFNNRTDYYQGSCGLINGTLGDFWPPLPDNKTISLFVPDVCTSVTLTYTNTTTFQDLEGNRYIGDKTMLDNGESAPSRKCYCPNGDCASGALNISSCKFGAPAFVSMPHFYLADPRYTEGITGMSPDKRKHELSLVLEPTTGIPMQVKAQLQLNLLIDRVENMRMFENINTTYIPMLWFSQEANLTADYASQVKLLLTFSTLGTVTFFGIAGIGLLMCLIGLFIYIRHWKGEEGQVLLSKYDNDVTNTNINRT